MAKLIVIGSGSKGNASLLCTSDANFLIDVGISYARVIDAIGTERKIDFVLISHEHTDHTKGLSTLYKKTNATICLHEKTFRKLQEKMDISRDRCIFFEEDDSFVLNNTTIKTISTPHDSMSSVAFYISSDEVNYAHATDLGYMPESLIVQMTCADIATMECNYDTSLLDLGSYPYHLKLRIKSKSGHLSNDDGLECVARLLKAGVTDIVIAHLSEENNNPHLLRQALNDTINDNAIEANQSVHIATQKFENLVIEVKRNYVNN